MSVPRPMAFPKHLVGQLSRAALAVAATAVALAMGAAMPPRSSSQTPDQAFLAANQEAMARMIVGMEVKASKDVDHNFAAMMIPHHQGAVDLAVLELRYGRNERLRRIAQEIIVGQQQEIAAMHLELGESTPPSAPAPTSPAGP